MKSAYGQPQNIFEKLYADIGQRSGRQLFEALSQPGSLLPKLTLPKVLAVTFAGLVYSLILVLFVFGLQWLLWGWPNLLRMLVGLMSLMLAMALLPRFGPIPQSILPRAQYPKLYGLADAVSQCLGTKPVDGIVVSRRFTASYGLVGWRGQTVLTLGLTPLAALNDQEKVYVFGHELGHAVNGDLTRTNFVGPAINSLSTLYSLLRTDEWSDRPRAYSILSPDAHYFMALIAVIPWMGAFLLSNLLWRDQQRAEYLADRLGADVGGNEAAIACLQKLYLARTTFLKSGLAFRGRQDLFSEIKRRLEDVGPLNQADLILLEAGEDSRLDSTHPPTISRIRMLRAHAGNERSLSLLPGFFDALDQELAPLRQRMQADIEEHFASLVFF